jgi:hypothetical protein
MLHDNYNHSEVVCNGNIFQIVANEPETIDIAGRAEFRCVSVDQGFCRIYIAFKDDYGTEDDHVVTRRQKHHVDASIVNLYAFYARDNDNLRAVERT